MFFFIIWVILCSFVFLRAPYFDFGINHPLGPPPIVYIYYNLTAQAVEFFLTLRGAGRGVGAEGDIIKLTQRRVRG